MQGIVSSLLREMPKLFILLFLGLYFLFCGCKQHENKSKQAAEHPMDSKTTEAFADSSNHSATPKEHIANTFDFSVGKPDAKWYYNARAFGENNHLGDDCNAVTGGNSGLGINSPMAR